MRRTILTIVILGFATFSAQAADGMINVKSAHDVKTTADKLENVLNNKGMTVFKRIDHAAGAERVGQQLRPTELIIFGNPKIGSKLMKCSQSIAIDLPQKALIWQDANGDVWLSYNEPNYLIHRHKTQGCEPVFVKITGALANFAKAATAP